MSSVVVVGRKGYGDRETVTELDLREIKRYRAGENEDGVVFLLASPEETINDWYRLEYEDNKELFDQGVLPDPEKLPTPEVPRIIYGAWVKAEEGKIVKRERRQSDGNDRRSQRNHRRRHVESSEIAG